MLLHRITCNTFPLQNYTCNTLTEQYQCEPLNESSGWEFNWEGRRLSVSVNPAIVRELKTL